jgi:ParB family chromosome partitioning protein
MGRGLAAILPSTDAAGPELRQLPVDMIRPNPKQPRTQIADESIDALADSVRAAGVVQPVIVRPVAGGTYELIAGERRWRAARAASLETLPAVVREAADADRLELALIENMAREDLNPVDAAHACAGLVEELGLSKEEVGRRVGRSRSAVSNLIRLLELPASVLKLLEQGRLSEGHGRAILKASGNEARLKLAEAAVAQGWSVRETERRAGAAEPKPSREKPPVAIHPDREARRAQLEDQLEAVLGHELRVRLERSEVVAELRFESLEEMAEFADRFAVGKAA